ncbi:Trypsin domain containing protein [Asbolus verrucosus]|uniref:Trypsin domain containing protein n=1 Tax=Asbolus verrucosus TaxID=1661398 RepID=A0A482VBK6_ASBVE|nr:Trypsin domain containing protein [Asbolus verrucosus]
MDYLILFLFLSTLSVGFFLALKNKNIDVSKGLLTRELAQSDKYPFAAAIYVKTTTNTSFCGGTLLTNQWILTAGQCVYGAELFTIYLGSNDVEGDNPNRITVITTDYVLYPDFNPETLQHDVALIKLPMPIELNEYVRRADLPKRDVEIGATFITINWAQSSDQEPRVNTNLLTVLSNTECTMTNYNRITQDMICLSGSYNEGICVVSVIFNINVVN